jgi:cytochrome c-type biogenesis protein CcmH/NrfF
MRNQTSKFAFLLILIVVGVAIFFTFLLNRPSTIESNDLEHRVLVVAGQLHAPGDKNTMTVATSSLTLAQHMRYQIQTYIQTGMTNPQIISKMEQIYGEDVLAAPADSGNGRVAWVAPWLVLVLLLVGVVRFLRKTVLRRRPAVESRQSQSMEDTSHQELLIDIPNQLKDYL